MAETNPEIRLSFKEMCARFDVTPRTLRYYEYIELLFPEKEGRARFNEAMRDPAVLEAALARFGCCPPEHARALAHRLLGHGRAALPGGHEVRLAVFASTTESPGRPGALVVGPCA